MNNVEINSYINAKKQSKLYIENEICGAQQVLSDLKEQKPVRWYHNVYIGKRILYFPSCCGLPFFNQQFFRSGGLQKLF